MRWIQNARLHLKTINHHRKLVRESCFKLGLYWQGLTHDLSKYTWPEFKIGIKYYLDGQSPHNGERKVLGYSTAWLHHKGRNKHHAEYWIDFTTGPIENRYITGMKMPVKYLIEMFVDRVSASKNYHGVQYKESDALEYYKKRRDCMLMDDRSRKQLEILLQMLAEKGEDYTFAFIRRKILRNNHWEKLQHIFWQRGSKG